MSTSLAGQKFTRLAVVEQAGSNKHRQKLWLCVCDCGVEVILSTNVLTTGNTKSCGCLSREKVYSGYGSPEYSSYSGAKDRCNNPKSRHYIHYGGRGIKFLFKSFAEFYEELGPKPTKKHSVDRIEMRVTMSPAM